MSIQQILTGFRNKLLPPKRLKELISSTSEQRLTICSGCPHNSEVAKANGVSFSSSWRMDNHCIICQCNLGAKTSCLSCDCPVELWKAVATESEAKEIEEGADGE